LFVRTVAQCVEAGLVDGRKLHVDGSLIEANASKESVVKGSPQLIAALKCAYGATESKLEHKSLGQREQPVNERMMSRTDPEATLTHQGSGDSRPRYKHHRVVDDAKGVITAMETTPGSVAENHKLMSLVAQHEKNTQVRAQTVVADHQYGTNENFVACQQRGITTHMGDATSKMGRRNNESLFDDKAFTYDAKKDVYLCPAGQSLKPLPIDPVRRRIKYKASAAACKACALRGQCTTSSHGRTLHRYENQDLLDIARAQAHSVAARRHRKRRRHLMEGSFADATNNHHFKRARWRRLWRQQIQDYLIGAVQNVRILLVHGRPKRTAAAAATAWLRLRSENNRFLPLLTLLTPRSQPARHFI
jgi:hypothetical protein